MGVGEDFIRTLDRWDVNDIILPFLLVFVVVYAILEKTQILGADKKRLNVGISLVVGLLFIFPHVTGRYPAGFNPVEVLQETLPQISLIAVAVIFLLVLIGVFAQDKVMLGASAPGWVAILSILAVAFVFLRALDLWPDLTQWTSRMFGSNTLLIVVMILVAGVVISYITGSPGERRSEDRGLSVDFNKLFGKD